MLSAIKLFLTALLVASLLSESTAINASNVTAHSANRNASTNSTANGDGKLSLPNPADEVKKLVNETKNLIIDTLRNMSQYLPVSIEYAETVGRNCNIIENNRDYYSVPGLIISGALFLVGLLFCIVGYRLIKINLFILGLVIGGSLIYIIFLALLNNVQGEWKLYVAIGLAVVVGALFGGLLICIYYIGLFLAGASIGFLLSWLLLSAIDVPFFQSHAYVPILVAAAAGIICGIITLIFQKWLVIIGTSILGSFLLVWALDYFLELAQMMYFLVMFAANREKLQLCWFSWVLVGLFPVFVIASLLVQFLLTGRKYDHKKDLGERGICCGLWKRCKKRKSSNYIPLKSSGAEEE